MNQNAKRRRRVVEALVKAQEVEESQGQPGIVESSDQKLLDVVRPQRGGDEGIVEESRFPAPVSSDDTGEDRHEVVVVFVIISGEGFGRSAEASRVPAKPKVCDGTVRTNCPHFRALKWRSRFQPYLKKDRSFSLV